MAKARFVLRYRGEGPTPDADVARVRAVPGATIVESTSRMLLVEAEPKPLHKVVETLHHWVLAPEQTYLVPDTRKKVEGPPE